MAKVKIEMPDEFLNQIAGMGNVLDAAIPKALAAGGRVVLEKMKSNLQAAIGRGTKTKSRSTGMYPIQIYPNKMFDLFAPIVRTKRDVISADYEHIYYNGELCLEVPTKVAIEWRKNPNLLTFVNQLVLPWFYSYEYYMRHKQYPFGVREHGLDGWFQLYYDLFEVSSSEQVIALLRGVISAPYFCHEKCPCGSGKTYSECHKPQIMGMKNSSNYSLYKQDYERFTRRT